MDLQQVSCEVGEPPPAGANITTPDRGTTTGPGAAVHRRSEIVWDRSFGQVEADTGTVRALHWARQQSTQKGGDQHG